MHTSVVKQKGQHFSAQAWPSTCRSIPVVRGARLRFQAAVPEAPAAASASLTGVRSCAEWVFGACASAHLMSNAWDRWVWLLALMAICAKRNPLALLEVFRKWKIFFSQFFQDDRRRSSQGTALPPRSLDVPACFDWRLKSRFAATRCFCLSRPFFYQRSFSTGAPVFWQLS